MLTDIEIAQAATLLPIHNVAEKLGLSAEAWLPYGHHIAKLTQATVSKLQQQPARAKLILVTAISPTPAGEGKTTTTIGLTDALNHAGYPAMACLREPSMGPVFGMKGGATGGGYAQVVPMENINLHFTGDFHAISAANNLLAALIDNHIYHGNALGFEHVSWRRCMDMNDRALRRVTLDHEVHTGFDITVASEVMAIFCLATDLQDLTARLGRIQVGSNAAGNPIFASDLQAEGAMTALLKDAFQPNLVQTLAGSPALVHGGPFANIAHGCNSLVATRSALRLADYVVTEAGFGADLGAEKFMDIKCRQSGLRPDVAVLVATVRALKYHGGIEVADLNNEHLDALQAGLANLKKHLDNLHHQFGLPVLVALNHFSHDTEAEVALVDAAVQSWGYQMHVCKHWANGASGASDLAKALVTQLSQASTGARLAYADDVALEEKLALVARQIYGADGVAFSPAAQAQLHALAAASQGLPVCVAKTQYSFSCDPKQRNVPVGHTLLVRELRLARGAGFVVAICGDIMTMPGLPKQPASIRIGVAADGKISGLS
ncbi:formate--tetrahydrofolate ligase [Methylophilus aquaticus]|uniref:Formate--tetrahydrofolate ligase n=1 Tax=Methylophilus aquaticus TaxID=1971610 RepID=A0ABT9JT07_9PROT|nr:formate--tetrahydrofolate ligase [Methylophilus aquaticus]MDP8567708.1 formate--tetrahydrofolate ligase [Methylophilus aquaticus]